MPKGDFLFERGGEKGKDTTRIQKNKQLLRTPGGRFTAAPVDFCPLCSMTAVGMQQEVCRNAVECCRVYCEIQLMKLVGKQNGSTK